MTTAVKFGLQGERPEVAAPSFKTFSGMDLPYWREFSLLGEVEELAEKIRAKAANLGAGASTSC